MNFEEDLTFDDIDSGNETSGDDVDFALEAETSSSRDRQSDADEYVYEVLTTEEIVQYMIDCIHEVIIHLNNHLHFFIGHFMFFVWTACQSYHCALNGNLT